MIPNSADWLAAWRQLAADTAGLASDDPRLQPVLDGLNVCDDHFLKGDWNKFQEASEKIKGIMKGKI